MPGINTDHMECVYLCEATGEFKSTQVSLKVGNKAEIYVKPDVIMTEGELKNLLDELSHGVFRKFNLHNPEECSIFMDVDNQVYPVGYKGDMPVIHEAP